MLPPRTQWIVLSAVLLMGCNRSATELPPPVDPRPAAPAPRKFQFEYKQTASTQIEQRPLRKTRFTDVAAEMSLEFTYQNGADERVLMVESIGAGCGWLDYDRDGQWDLYFPQGGNATADHSSLRPDETQATGHAEAIPVRPGDQLFALRAGRFVDVTALAGIQEREYGQGVAIGDYNSDGFDDVYVTNIQGVPDTLFENLGDGTFRNATSTARVSDPLWSTSAAWADLDRDGDLDLYVCNYCEYDVHSPIPCLKDGRPATCHPRDIPPVPDQCYENLGDGTFRPVAADAGLFGSFNRGLAVVIADLTGDDWPDVYVANDTTANFLFVNQRDFRFVESAFRLGAAFDARGAAHASMGIALGDYDQDQWPDLSITAFSGEYNTLYRNRGEHGFQDVSGITGLIGMTTPKLGWGTLMADFNQDGQQELICANGHIGRDVADGEGYEMTALLAAFNGAQWQDVSRQGGPYFERKLLGRGIASADFDRDGDLDLTIVHQNVSAALLRNDSERGHWLTLEFAGRVSNRRGIGTRVVVQSAGRRWTQQLVAGSSFASSHQPLLAFGLGEEAGPLSVTVHWPSGRTQTLNGVVPDQSLFLVEPREP